MKNILIPTQLGPDTINAVMAAIKYSHAHCAVTLLLLNEVGDSFSAAATLRTIGDLSMQGNKDILHKCREIINNTLNCTIKVHNQAGISAPLVKNILNHFNTELIIVTAGYQANTKKINKQCLQLLLNSKYPILHLGNYCREQDFNKAFYIEYNKCPVKTEVLTRVVKNILPVKTITSKKIFTDGKDNYIPPHLAEAILSNNTDLLIETRKPERVNVHKTIKSPAEKLGISVLSIFEDAI